jgi:hypothetical protein
LRDFEGVPDSDFGNSLDRAEASFDVMGELDASLLLVCSNANEDSSADVERSATQLFELAERGSRRGIRIGYEALAWGEARLPLRSGVPDRRAGRITRTWASSSTASTRSCAPKAGRRSPSCRGIGSFSFSSVMRNGRTPIR